MATIQQLPSGNWRVQFYVDEPDGTRKRMSLTAPTRWQAEKMAAEYIEKREKMTVKEALDGYIQMKQYVLSPSTLYGYDVIKRNRLQGLMNIEITKLTSVAVQRAINEDAKSSSRKSIAEALHLVIAALRMYGVQTEFNVTLPARKPVIKNLPTAQQVIRMVHGSNIELPCLLALWLSLRISEVRGLQFRDLNGNLLTVQRSKLRIGSDDVVRDVNKTFSSTRQLVVPEYLMQLILAVPHEREDDFIVPEHYQTITKRLKKLADANGFQLTFHDLRHLNASVMLMLGVPNKYAQERGGWSTDATLKNVYQHTFSEERERVDEMIDRFFENTLEELED